MKEKYPKVHLISNNFDEVMDVCKEHLRVLLNFMDSSPGDIFIEELKAKRAEKK